MKPDHLSDRARLAILAVGRAGRTAVDQVLKAPLYRWRLGSSQADRLLLVPQDLRTADPSFATEIDHGHFGLAGAIAKTDSQSPFNIVPPNKSWERELYGFSWLRNLRASHDELAEELSRTLVKDWINRSRRGPDLAWNAEIVARRIISWLSHAPLILDHATQIDHDRIMASLTQQMRFLAISYRDTPEGLPRLLVLIALVLAGLCVAEQDAYLREYLKPFVDQLEIQILADGGHVSRNPQGPVELLLDLLPLRQCFVARNRKAPAALTNVVQRMIPFIRFMRLGDGYLARFNGMTATLPDEVSTVLAYEESQLTHQNHAVNSGYCRLERQNTIVIIDAGGPPPLNFSSDAHAGCLSFEMSREIHPIVVNCGAPGPANQEWRVKSRATVAHSTLTVAETSSSKLLQHGNLKKYGQPGSYLSGPSHVEAKMRIESNHLDVHASHDGYVNRYGLTHSRRLVLSPDGLKLDGEDQLFAPSSIRDGRLDKENPFAIRFHIHPNVRVTRSEDGTSAFFDLPNHERWRFSAGNFVANIEETLFLAHYRGPRRSIQIVLRGVCKKEVRVNWQIERVETQINRPKKILKVI